MLQALVNGRVLSGGALLARHAVLVDGERIQAIVAEDDPRCASAQAHDLHGALLLPGFIDCQVNGGGGVLFNDAPSVATIARIGAAHRRFGTTGFLPTLISDDLAVVAQAIAAVAAAIGQGVPGVLGIHIEGPFLNEARKGAHDAAKFRDLDAAATTLLTSLPAGRTLVTLAPEMTTPQTIARLVAAGVIVAAGHSNGSYAAIGAALRAGLTGFTHLFNAMSPLTGREPGVVGAALDDADSWCGIIVDGHHVHPAALRVALRCKRRDRLLLVTDAMPGVGTGQDSFLLQGRRISVRDGICTDESGTLAGSALDMATAVRNAVHLLDLDLVDAVRMASEYPAQFLGLGAELGRIAPGFRANFVVASDELEVRETWINGRRGALD